MPKPEPIVLDGRRGEMTYFTRDDRRVSSASPEAVKALVIFEDGGRRVFRVTPLPDEFDLGGPGSGNFGHAGRPGEIGGSAPADEGGAGGSKGSGSDKIIKSLGSGKAKEATPIDPGGHANTAYMVEFTDGSKGVFKPEHGEMWDASFINTSINESVTNRAFSLAEREATAYEIDQAMGTELVPETVLRTSGEDLGVDASDSGSDDDEHVMDESDIRDAYDEYRESARDDLQDDAYEHAGEVLAELYTEAKQEHADNINDRFSEIGEIWNEIIDEHPEWAEIGEHGSRTAQARHPTLPMEDPDQTFKRQSVGGDKDVNPIALLDEASVDVDGEMNASERARVREILEERLKGGAVKLLDVDPDAARDHLDYDKFVEAHQDTEMRAIDSYIDDHIKSYDSWRANEGYTTPGSGPHVKNPEAPHPTGGMMQAFVPDLRERVYDDLSMQRGDHFKFAVLDYMVGSMDRHGGNVFSSGDLDEGGKPLAMDNGYSMPDTNEVTFRSAPVMSLLKYSRDAEDAGTDPPTFPTELREKYLDNIKKTDWNEFVKRHPSMSEGEKESFLERVNNMTTALETPDGLLDLWKNQSVMR